MTDKGNLLWDSEEDYLIDEFLIPPKPIKTFKVKVRIKSVEKAKPILLKDHEETCD